MSWMDEVTVGYQLKITLKNSKPKVWRRFVVPADIPLDRLHIVIQIVMGWENMHLHRFVIDRQPYYEQTDELFIEGKEERGVSLRDALNGGVEPFVYDYDFGDDWKHIVQIEKQLEVSSNDRQVLLCIAGANACPLEDSGGVYWCAEQRMENPEEYEGEEFNLKRINEELQEYLQWNCEQRVV